MKCLNDVSHKDCVGRILKSKNFGDFKILKYNDSRNVEIQFLTTGYETTVQLGDIRSGEIKDPYLASVFGVGVVGAKYPTRVNGRKQKNTYYGVICSKGVILITLKRNTQLI